MRRTTLDLARFSWCRGKCQSWDVAALEWGVLKYVFSSDSQPPGEDPPSEQKKGARELADEEEGKNEEETVLSKAELPYRPVEGLNKPYPKLTEEMDTFIFKDMESCEQIEAAVYKLWDRLTMREVEAAFFSLKRLNTYPPVSLLDRLSQKTIALSEHITCRNTSAIFLAAARIKYFNPALFNCLARESMKQEKLRDFHGVFCGTVVYSIGALQRHFLRTRDENMRDKIELYFPMQMQFLNTLVERTLAVGDEAGFTNKNISNYLYGLAMMQYRHEPVLNILAEEATRVERLALYWEQEASNIIYSLGVLNFRHERVLSVLSERMCQPEWLREWTDQGLSNAVYGFALLEYRPPNETMFGLIWEICKEERLRRFRNQHLMNVIYGFATLGITSYRVFKCLLDELISRRHRFEFMTSGISSVIYSFANAGIFTEGLKIFYQDLTMERNLKQLSDWSVTNLIYSVGKFKREDELLPFLQKLVKEAVNAERMSRYAERHFAQILFGISNTELRTKIDPMHISLLVEGASVPGILTTFTNQGLANMVYALTHLSYVDRGVHDRFSAEVIKRIPDCEGIALATFVYSWSLIPYKNTSFLEAVLQKLKTPGVVDTYAEQILGNLMLGLIRLDVEDVEGFRRLTDRIRHPDILQQFLYQISPKCIEEILMTESIDEAFRELLEMHLKEIYIVRGHEQTHKLSI